MALPSMLTTVNDVIDALGGSKAVQRITGVRTVQAVWEWRNRGVIASRFYLLMTDALVRLGHEADPKLWGQAEPAADDITTGRDGHDAEGLSA